VADHVHLLVRLHPDVALSQAVQHFKARSSLWVHQTFPGLDHFAWQTGYGAFSVSQSSAGRVRRYIAYQEAHHAKRSFQDEFRAFLRAHGFACDEQTTWD
jgi:putative transposase